MCWTETRNNINVQIADKDIEVYKVVFKASKQSCESCIKGFMYEANIRYKIPFIYIKKSYIGSTVIFCVEKAYHSYTKIRHTLRRLDEKNPTYGVKGIIVGNQLIPLPINNPYYVATFVIPKGSQYAVNWKGEIISNQIIYTGKHLKL